MNCWVKRVIAVVIDCLLIGIPIGIIEMAFSLIRWIMSWLPLIHHFRFLFFDIVFVRHCLCSV